MILGIGGDYSLKLIGQYPGNSENSKEVLDKGEKIS
jgi:hypothetical protein